MCWRRPAWSAKPDLWWPKSFAAAFAPLLGYGTVCPYELVATTRHLFCGFFGIDSSGKMPRCSTPIDCWCRTVFLRLPLRTVDEGRTAFWSASRSRMSIRARPVALRAAE
jgi:hypothetical protein